MNSEPIVENTIKPASNQKPLLLAGVAALVLMLGACALLAGLLLFVDPLNFHLLERLTGRWDAAAEAMPEDTVMYLGGNLLNIKPKELARVLEPFQELIAEETGEPITTLDDLTTKFDAEVLSQVDMTFAEDIQPWIGQYLGVGLVDFTLDKYGDLDAFDFVGVVEVRNKKAADAFLDKIKAQIAERSGTSFIKTEYRGVMISEINPSGEFEQMAFARSGNLLLISNQSRNLKRAIDSQAAASLAAKPVYEELFGELPKDRLLHVYLSGDRLTELLYASADALGGTGVVETTQYLDGVAMSISIVEEGFQVDSWIAYDAEGVNEEQQAMLAVAGEELDLGKILPANTVFFTGGVHLDLVWQANKAALAQTTGMGEDWDAAMDLFAEQFGFNPDTDLFPYLDGEWDLAIIPANDGILMQQMQVPLGALFAADTSDADQMAGVVDDIFTTLEAMGAPIEEVEIGDAALKQVYDPMMGSLFTFGVSDQRLVIATSSSVVGMLTDDQETLAKSDRYRKVVQALPRRVNPLLYLDLEKMLAEVRGNLSDDFRTTFDQSVNYLKPIPYVVAGSSAVKDNLAHQVIIIFIQQE